MVEIKIIQKEEYEVTFILNKRELSILQALFGLQDLPRHLGKSFVEYTTPSKELFDEIKFKLRPKDDMEG